MEKGTSPKTLRIPNTTIADIEKTAKENNTTFSKEAINRLQNKGNKNFPLFLTKTQTILCLCTDAVKTGNVDLLKEAQEEEKKLWIKYLML